MPCYTFDDVKNTHFVGARFIAPVRVQETFRAQ